MKTSDLELELKNKLQKMRKLFRSVHSAKQKWDAAVLSKPLLNFTQ
jgi:hypothetical protein